MLVILGMDLKTALFSTMIILVPGAGIVAGVYLIYKALKKKNLNPV